jgi:phage gp45-like
VTIESILQQILRPINARFSQLIARGRVEAKEGDTLQVQFQKEDIQDGIERIEPFGFYSNPGDAPEALILFPDGYRSRGIAIALTRKNLSKPTLLPGSATMTASDGTSVIVEDGGKIAIQNNKNELISILVELIDKINSIAIETPTVQANLPCLNGSAAGPISIPQGSIDKSSQADLNQIQKRLKTFQKGSA